MQPTRIQSVYGYLTPKRILSNFTNSSQKTKSNQSMADPQSSPTHFDQNRTNMTASPRKGRQSYRKKMSQDNPPKVSGGFIDNSNLEKIQRFNTMHSKLQIKSIAGSQSFSPPKIGTNGSAIMVEGGQQSLNVSSNGGNKFNKEGNRYKQIKQQNISPSQIIGFQKKASQSNAFDTRSRKFSSSSKKNAEMSQLIINEIINRLTNAKNELEQEISSLKTLLDQTSATREYMDSEYQKFKEKVLTYTSRALDTAFRQYKKNLPNWAIYESVEESGLQKINEISQAIEICQDQERYKLSGGKQVMQKKLQHYGLVLQQVKDARMDCNSQRPFITEEKIKRFQAILKQIGHF